MLTKNEIKHISSLTIKKYRETHKEFTVEGVKMVSELIRSGFGIKKIYCIDEWYKKNVTSTNDGKFEIEIISEKDLKRISSLSTPNLVLAVACIPEDAKTLFDPSKELILVLDGIQDPGNLGTIIRTADWFGIKKIICSKNTVDIFNPKVIQSTMGSLFRVDIIYADLAEFLMGQNNETCIYGALLDGEIIYNKKLSKNGVLIIGNESKGISNEIKPFVTDKLFIPQFNSANDKNAPESLNASIAMALICYEFSRQNHKK